MSLQDLKVRALETLTGSTGSISDLEMKWLVSEDVPYKGSLQDMWREFFRLNGFATNNITDSAYLFLVDYLGYGGDINKLWYDYWAAGGGTGTPVVGDRIALAIATQGLVFGTADAPTSLMIATQGFLQ